MSLMQPENVKSFTPLDFGRGVFIEFKTIVNGYSGQSVFMSGLDMGKFKNYEQFYEWYQGGMKEKITGKG